MASFINDTEINRVLEKLIKEAENELVLVCPYFKLHDRVKDCLKLRKEDYNLRIIIVFGKNPYDRAKSLNKEDFEFLKSFPYIDIVYEKRLHAKYYSNDKSGLITSLNLLASSQNNNIEVGVLFNRKNFLKNLTDKTLGDLTSIISDTENLAVEAHSFFLDIFKNAEKIFQKEAKFKKTMLNLSKSYSHSEVILDNSDCFNEQFNENNFGHPSAFNANSFQSHSSIPEGGFCIRTKEKILFDPFRPYSRSAYYKWVETANPDNIENYCHACGENHNSSFRDPLCPACSQSIS